MAGTQVRNTRSRPGAAEPTGESAVRRRPSPRTVLAIASLGGAVAFIDATIVNIALPDIARSFPGTSISTLSWILNGYNIIFAAFLVAAGRIADLLGRRRVFIFGLELFTAGSLLCAIAPSEGTLIAFRIVQALGPAFLVPSARAAVGGAQLQHLPAAHRAAAGSRPRDVHRRFAGQQPAGADDGRHGRGPDHRGRREGRVRAPEARSGGTRMRHSIIPPAEPG